MNRIVYLPYRPLRDRIWSGISHSVPKKQRRLDKQSVMREALEFSLSLPGATRTLDSNALVDEEAYFKDGCPMFFPESPALLETLWRANMQLKLDDLDLAAIPKAFSVAWPRCEIAKAPMEGCLVTVLNGHQHNALVADFGVKYLGYPLEVNPNSIKFPLDEMRLYLTYFGPKMEMGHPLFRCCIPAPIIEKTLDSEASFDHFMSESPLKNVMVGVMDLEPKEVHQQYVMARLVMALLVYMQACPEHVRAGIPEGRKEREFSSPYFKPDWHVIGAPSGLRGEHASPCVHWRVWHFRSYPLRKDGTRKKGAVFVKGTMVNAEIDPVTVDDETWKERTQAHS